MQLRHGMEMIKTYSLVHRRTDTAQFHIARMEELWDKSGGMPDEPHRHDYYTVLLVGEARGRHHIDFNAYPLARRQVFFVSPEQVHQVVEEERPSGYVFMFTCDFLIANTIPESFIDDLNLFNVYGQSPPLPLNDAEFENLSALCEQMLDLSKTPVKFGDRAFASLLQLFLIACNNLCSLSIDNPQVREAGNSLLKNFRQLVNENHASWHSTAEYAAVLHVTPDHLNRVVRSLTGKTAKEYIQARIIVAAKRLMHFSGNSQKEIAYALGFSEPGNFSAFFKNFTGESPSVFKKKT